MALRLCASAASARSRGTSPMSPVEEESYNLSNGRRQRDDGSEGVANSDQIVDVHLILAGGDGRSLMPPKGYTIKASRRLRAIPWPACRLKVEAELEARRFCRPAEGGNCCRPRRATRARAGSHPCEKQAVAITLDAGDPPRGRAIRIAGRWNYRKADGSPVGWGHGWGWFSYVLLI